MSRSIIPFCGPVMGLLLGAAPAFAGGIERTPQSVAPIFETGNYMEMGFTHTNPTLSGHDIAGFGGSATGNIAGSYNSYTLAYKQDFSSNLSGAIIVETPYGADSFYPTGRSIALGGTRAKVKSSHVSGILHWHDAGSGFGVHGGVRISRANALVGLDGMGYGPFAGYSARLDRNTAWGWLAGVSYEIPEIAARVVLTYNSAITHDFHTIETAPLPGLNGTSTTKVRTPRSWNLDFQSGVARDTLIFGSIRWVKWSEMKVEPQLFTGATGLSLVNLEDTTTFTLGVGHQITDQWAGSAAISYEKRGDDLVSPLLPLTGLKGITLAAIYSQDNMKITTGINYTRLGDAKAAIQPTSADPADPRAQMEGSHALTIGTKLSFSF